LSSTPRKYYFLYSKRERGGRGKRGEWRGERGEGGEGIPEEDLC
jgi:hypothetical protein